MVLDLFLSIDYLAQPGIIHRDIIIEIDLFLVNLVIRHLLVKLNIMKQYNQIKIKAIPLMYKLCILLHNMQTYNPNIGKF